MVHDLVPKWIKFTPCKTKDSFHDQMRLFDVVCLWKSITYWSAFALTHFVPYMSMIVLQGTSICLLSSDVRKLPPEVSNIQWTNASPSSHIKRARTQERHIKLAICLILFQLEQSNMTMIVWRGTSISSSTTQCQKGSPNLPTLSELCFIK